MEAVPQRRDEACDPIDLFVGGRVRSLRKHQRLTQTDLGGKIGVSFQQIQKYERGANRISISMLFRIAGALRVPLADFFVGLPDTGSAANDQGIVATRYTHDPDLGLIDAALRMPPDIRTSFVALARALAAPIGQSAPNTRGQTIRTSQQAAAVTTNRDRSAPGDYCHVQGDRE